MKEYLPVVGCSPGKDSNMSAVSRKLDDGNQNAMNAARISNVRPELSAVERRVIVKDQ